MARAKPRNQTSSPAPSVPAGPPPAWLGLHYLPVTPFSLRPSQSTSAGGKTLLVPTPYAIKLALVDAEIRRADVPAGERLFELLRGAPIGLLPAKRTCVTQTFVKSLKKRRDDGSKKVQGEDDDDGEEPGSETTGPFDQTLRYREICMFSGPILIAIGLRSPGLGATLAATARHVNYFGKRGGFFQLGKIDELSALDERTTVVDPLGWSPATTPAGDLACALDDLGPRATLARVSPFSDESAKWGEDRVAHMRILALRRVQSAAHFTLYERLGG